MIFGVLLAAGTGSRFDGDNKLLSAIDGEPIARRAARTLVDETDAAIAVVGHEAGRVRDALADLPIATVENPAYERGQGTSVRCGATVARERGAAAVVFALGDMPNVTPRTYRKLLDAHRNADAEVVVPTYEGRRGNPVVFDGAHLDRLAALDGDAGGRQLFEDVDVVRVECDDSGVLADVDTVDDLAAVRRDGDPSPDDGD